jgi:hypothetical protein
MAQIYTANNNSSLVVEQTIWSGVIKLVKNKDGSFERFYRTHNETKFTKTGWGKKAKQAFEITLKQIKQELAN